LVVLGLDRGRDCGRGHHRGGRLVSRLASRQQAGRGKAAVLTMRKRLSAAAVATCAILGLACSEPGPVALGHVLGGPPTSSTLEAQCRLGVRSAMSPQTFPAPSGGFGAETSFVVVLPQGSTGRLAIDLTARDPAGCVLASGSGGQDVSAGARIDLSIVLSPIGGPCGSGGDGGPLDGSADGEPDGLPPSEVPH